MPLKLVECRNHYCWDNRPTDSSIPLGEWVINTDDIVMVRPVESEQGGVGFARVYIRYGSILDVKGDIRDFLPRESS